MHNNDNIDNFENTLKKLQVTNAIPAKIKKKIHKYERADYIELLKKTGQYSLFAACSAYIIFFFKKIGISLTIFQSSVILVISSATIVISIAMATIFSINYFATDVLENNVVKPINEIKTTTVKEKITQAKTKNVSKKSLILKRPFILIESFKTESVNNKILKVVKQNIFKSLSHTRGKKSILGSLPQNNDYVILKGYVDFIDGQYVVDVKIYDVKKFEYILFATETVTGVEKLGYACEKISTKIDQKLNAIK